MPKLTFNVSPECFSANDEVMLKAFKQHLHNYKVKSMSNDPQEFIDCAFDLFHITRTQSESIKQLEVKLGIRPKEKKPA